MSVEKIRKSHEKSIQITQKQVKITENIYEQLFSLGKDWSNSSLSFREFKKKFESLVLSDLDLEKLAKELAEALEDTENLINEVKNNENKPHQEKENELNALLGIQKILTEWEDQLKLFTKSILTLRNSRQANRSKSTVPEQTKTLKTHLVTMLKKEIEIEAIHAKSSLLQSMFSNDQRTIFGSKLDIYFGILSIFNDSEETLNPLISKLFSGWVDIKISAYKTANAQKKTYVISPNQRFQPNTAEAETEEDIVRWNARPRIRFSLTSQ